MSHFTVLVIGDDHEKQLQPFHEFECTGVEDQYVVDVDVTDEIAADFNKPQKVVRLSTGEVFDRYDDQFWTMIPDTTAMTGKKREFLLPVGAEEVEMPADEARTHGLGYLTMDQCAEENYGIESVREGKYYRRTNPNAQWDWYKVGGRWTGFFKLKQGAKGELGRPGLMTEPGEPGFADMARKSAINFDSMRDVAGLKAGVLWDKCRSIISAAGGMTDFAPLWFGFDHFTATLKTESGEPDYPAARTAYWSQPAVEILKKSGIDDFMWDIDEMLAGGRDEYIQAQRDREGVPYAVVRESQWYSKGKMGWWGISTGEVGQTEWNRKVAEMIDGLPDDTMLTLVDCHI